MLIGGIHRRGNNVTSIGDLTYKRGDDPAARIVPRDLEVAVRTAQGMERDAIATDLDISRSAVNRHLRKLFDLTGTKNAAALVALLLAHGVITPRDVDPALPPPRRAVSNSRTKVKALKIVRGCLLKDPAGEVDEHVNQVIASIHDELEAAL
jgi:DNA-binding CsgD family transcriptional regulator